MRTIFLLTISTALYALPPTLEGPGTLSISTSIISQNFGTLKSVLLDSSQYRTQNGIDTVGDYQQNLPAVAMWNAGIHTPVKFLGKVFGLGVEAIGPYGKFRSFRSNTPYDFTVLRYGAADQQFRAIVGMGTEIIPDVLNVGVGSSVFLTGAGEADASLIADNPTGRWYHDVGINSNFIANILLKTSPLHFGLRFQQEISPKFEYAFSGQAQILAGATTMNQPFSLSTYLYFEPETWDVNVEWPQETFSVSLGLALQRWSRFQPSFLMVTATDASGNITSTKSSKPKLFDTLNPKLIALYKLNSKWTAKLGYEWRPTPISNETFSSDLNLLDSNTHIFVVGVKWQIENVGLSLDGGLNYLEPRRVTKASANSIGAPGYIISGQVWNIGLSSTTVL